ncbi:hypothetical protein HFP57_16985 [Parasphingopyxis algicola]|uniref:hypothetical protein n=1 Tax=Parasphingopyxis algicola TaxID=2026624 RepID=UPI0015A0817E|nr:hypothetical protein [Parasphingopyxis algicola]QLC26561.1 hypothetical protein HFP57_16985 [Parasphingopyxis algicola]
MLITKPPEFPGELLRTVDVLAEPCLIVTGEGSLLFANEAARDRWDLDTGSSLAGIDIDDALMGHIERSARADTSVSARLSLAPGNAAQGDVRCHGNLIRLAAAPADRWVLLRFAELAGQPPAH